MQNADFLPGQTETERWVRRGRGHKQEFEVLHILWKKILMSHPFPKYKKRHTLPTTLLGKNNSFSSHFPLISPTAQP